MRLLNEFGGRVAIMVVFLSAASSASGQTTTFHFLAAAGAYVPRGLQTGRQVNGYDVTAASEAAFDLPVPLALRVQGNYSLSHARTPELPRGNFGIPANCVGQGNEDCGSRTHTGALTANLVVGGGGGSTSRVPHAYLVAGGGEYFVRTLHYRGRVGLEEQVPLWEFQAQNVPGMNVGIGLRQTVWHVPLVLETQYRAVDRADLHCITISLGVYR